MKTCVLFNIINHRQENKTETSKPNLTNFASLFTSKSGRIGSVLRNTVLMFIGGYSVLSTLKDRILTGL
jgi:hypothetical protein